jgi:PKD repeat protein
MMKKLTLLMLGMLVLSLSFAQSVTLSGQVTDQLTGLPIPNHTVYLSADSSSGVLYWATVTTDAQGNYSDVAQVPANTAVDFFIYTYDCIGNWHSQTPQLAANGTTTGLPANFSICDSLTTGSCSASFVVSNVTGTQATFNASASTGSGSLAYGWDFGDGTTWNPSTGAVQVAHRYNAPGTYVVCLTITDSSSCTSTYCDSVVISGSSGCQSFFTHNASSAVGNRVFFYGSPTPSFGNSFSWDFGDGNTDNTRNPIHHYQNAGTYIVCLTISNSNGCTDTYCDSVYVRAGAGPCDANFSITPDSSMANRFYFTNTSTYNGTPATAYWTFGDGNTSRGFSSTSHTYTAAGTYTVCLYIVSGNCTDSMCQTVVVTSAPPATCSAGFTFTPDSTNGNRIYFQSTSTSSVSNPTYFWSFGDGNTRSGTSWSFQNPTHTYANPGTYNVCHIIIAGNCSDTVCQTITTTGPSQPVYIGGRL